MAVVRQLRGQLPGCQVVTLVSAQPPGVVRRLLAGDVRGIIDATAPVPRLLEAIRAAARAEAAVDPHLAIVALRARPNPLTARELHVLRLAADGKTGPAIARQLHLSAGTVRNYLSSAIGKTNGRNRFDAIRIASDAGWL
ncbi:MAG TPA: LuxR C-terminal-related transcriptional regulator [Actinophytocola sp.]|uniref:response regulator transcription factor n=1 Tax=Actinophytocola sp. TaxID=1872138 RepID=UPI002DDCA08D|nr:LuxR C-terminal-related transcriptional regulator [Actinophytocola sp.]HEV2784115.1 LuxR C-terminal-related transcriptional regulator [Actinophytocola sp.]